QIDFTPQQEKKIKPFNWQQKFPQVFKKGGAFDLVIGNPPYVNIENLDEVSKTYYFQKYKTCKGRTDIYIAFIENNLKNIRKNALISYIIPYAFTNQNYGSLLRELLIKKFFIAEIVDTSNFLIFSSANVRNIILLLQKTENQKTTNIHLAKSKENFINQEFQSHTINQEDFLSLKDFRLETKPVHHLLSIKEKVWANAIPLDHICLVAYGARLNHKTKKIGKEAYIHEKSKVGFKPFLEGKNIERYIFSQYGWLNYQPTEHYNSMFPELFENEKIMFINVVKDRLRFAYDDKFFYNSHTVINCVRIDKLVNANHISAKKAVQSSDLELCKKYSYKFLLGLLNSNLINWYFKTFLSESLHFYPNDAKNLPIKKIDFDNKIEKNIHDKIVTYVDQILSFHEQMKTIYSEMKKEPLKDRIAYAESQIDRLVCELYGLDEGEKEIVLE
ncbi:MAG: Eco57I restriction-modification methylase domain-containing protein, partial [Thermoflexibacter sp.]|nr:Eco57I restriction-modification methylase domain-containing protein [Thermoflexibacter sp.]